jgi:hypothetical protein
MRELSLLQIQFNVCINSTLRIQITVKDISSKIIVSNIFMSFGVFSANN